MNLEAGDIVHFDKLIGGMTIFGLDYTQPNLIGLPGSGIGQEIYPMFMIQEIRKSQSKVDLVLLQIHKFDENIIVNDALDAFGTDFGVNVHWDEEEEGDEGLYQIVLGDVNFDQEIDVIDVVQLTTYVLGNTTLGGYNFMAADVNQDSFIDVLDILTIVTFILSGMSYGDLGSIYV